MKKESDDEEYVNELLMKIEQLEFDNKVLKAQNEYMKENIKMDFSKELNSNRRNKRYLLKRVKNKIWRILNGKKN